MRNLTLLLLMLVVCAATFSKNVRKRRSISAEDKAESKRMLEDIDAGKVDLDQMFKGESPRYLASGPNRIRFRFRWPWRLPFRIGK